MMRWFWRIVPHRHIWVDEVILWGSTSVPIRPYCSRCLAGLDVVTESEPIGYDDLAPQDQVDRIAWEMSLDFDAALAEWCRRKEGST